MATQLPLSCFRTQAANLRHTLSADACLTAAPGSCAHVVHRVTCTLCTHPAPVGATPAETAKPPTDHTSQSEQAWPSRNVSQERNKQDSEADRVADDPADWHNREVASNPQAIQAGRNTRERPASQDAVLPEPPAATTPAATTPAATAPHTTHKQLNRCAPNYSQRALTDWS